MRKALLLAAALLIGAGSPDDTPLIIDGHNDTPEQLRTLFGNDFAKFDLNRLPPEAVAKTHTTIPLLRAGRVGGQFWSVWVDPALPKWEAVAQVVEQIDLVHQFAARYPETFNIARTADEVDAAIKAGRIASLIGMEGGHSIGGSLAILRQMYTLGARYMTLTHFLTTDWADSATDAPKHNGMTPFGFEVIREMNRLGMLIDLSHVSDTVMLQTLKASKSPVIFSHSDAKVLNGHPRNVPDVVLAQLRANGGVVMVNFLPDYVSEGIRQWVITRNAEKARLDTVHIGNPKAATAALDAWDLRHPRPRATLAQVADHIDHIRKLAGIDHIGMGSDFGGISDVPLGLENVSKFPALFAELKRRGYSRADLEKIAHGNILRVMRANEAVARSMK